MVLPLNEVNGPLKMYSVAPLLFRLSPSIWVIFGRNKFYLTLVCKYATYYWHTNDPSATWTIRRTPTRLSSSADVWRTFGSTETDAVASHLLPDQQESTSSPGPRAAFDGPCHPYDCYGHAQVIAVLYLPPRQAANIKVLLFQLFGRPMSRHSRHT